MSKRDEEKTYPCECLDEGWPAYTADGIRCARCHGTCR